MEEELREVRRKTKKRRKINKMVKKDKKIKFKQVSEDHIDIIMEYKEFEKGEFKEKSKKIGHIFGPSGSSNDITNAIQVCGFSEAFDYWGCGLFGKPKTNPKNRGISKKYYYNKDGSEVMEQVKDIQLYFDEDTKECALSDLEDCERCFNTPCTCNTFEIKREKDIKELEYKKVSSKNKDGEK
jgi:hypothetical protein